jgi:hypothetical protein
MFYGAQPPVAEDDIHEAHSPYPVRVGLFGPLSPRDGHGDRDREIFSMRS